MKQTKVFKAGVVPAVLPKEHTHARAKVIYQIFKAIAFMQRDKRSIALQELKLLNVELWDRVMYYLGQVTEADIAFVKGPRPHFHEDGKLAIYDPIKDNPLLMAVYHGEKPGDGRNIIVPHGALN